MYLTNAGDGESKNSKPLEQKGKSQHFQAAKQKAGKILKIHIRVEVIDPKTKEARSFPNKSDSIKFCLQNLKRNKFNLGAAEICNRRDGNVHGHQTCDNSP